MKIKAEFLGLLIVVGLSACTQSNSAPELSFSEYDKTVDLSDVVIGEWDRVCVFPPYSSNDSAKVALGFEWNLEKHSSVFMNDGVTLLVFSTNTKVVSYFEVPRGNVDFADIKTKCFKRSEASFKVVDGDAVPIEKLEI